MFGKTLSVASLCTALAVCSMLGTTTAIPVRRENAALFDRDLQPVKSDAHIQSGMVDLLDQYKNLAEQVAASTKGSPEFYVLEAKMNSTKADLETKVKGIAVSVDSPSTSTNTTVNATAAATSATAATTNASQTTSATSSVITTTASNTAPASSSIVTPAPSNNKVQMGGPLTIVTQIGTSIVVVASQGTTSTVTLATSISSSSTTTSVAGSGSGAASASPTFDINTMPAPDR